MYRFCLVLFLFFVFWVEPEKIREVIMMIKNNLVDPFFLGRNDSNVDLFIVL